MQEQNAIVFGGSAIPAPQAKITVEYQPEHAHRHLSQILEMIDVGWMSDAQKDQLAMNIAEGLVHASESARQRMLAQFGEADADYAARVQKAMLSLG